MPGDRVSLPGSGDSSNAAQPRRHGRSCHRFHHGSRQPATPAQCRRVGDGAHSGFEGNPQSGCALPSASHSGQSGSAALRTLPFAAHLIGSRRLAFAAAGRDDAAYFGATWQTPFGSGAGSGSGSGHAPHRSALRRGSSSHDRQRIPLGKTDWLAGRSVFHAAAQRGPQSAKRFPFRAHALANQHLRTAAVLERSPRGYEPRRASS